MAAVEDEDNGVLPLAARHTDDAFQAHGHVAEAAVLGKLLLYDGGVAEVVELNLWGCAGRLGGDCCWLWCESGV